MDLNVMMREHALSGLNTELDAAVTNGDAEAARKIADKIATLKMASAPKAPPYGDAEIRAELEKADWFGVDPKKSAKAVEFGKTLDPKKFGTAADYAKALIKAVDEEFKPVGTASKGEEGEGEDPPAEGEEGEGEGDDDTTPAAGKPKPAVRRTDGPGELRNSATNRRSAGPWSKLTDAPADVQKEIKRQADKFVPSSAKKEQRDKYIATALSSHYAAHQRAKGKK